MATIINNPDSSGNGNGGGTGMIIGGIILVVILILFFVYGLPAMRGSRSNTVNVPEQVDINVNDSTNK